MNGECVICSLEDVNAVKPGKCYECSSDEFKVFGWSSWSCIRDSKEEALTYLLGSIELFPSFVPTGLLHSQKVPRNSHPCSILLLSRNDRSFSWLRRSLPMLGFHR
ncbi:uncharacterized protein LOC112183977 [Rosa chinensis]|uniref:uncharacterized protein LOC112183977 n=1 Tax=Rosa chinensis TaxID=74649 RepID=UPI001AD8C6BA|nr:uncharacterized protein LOC112183977 [Rosa chinensis]